MIFTESSHSYKCTSVEYLPSFHLLELRDWNLFSKRGIIYLDLGNKAVAMLFQLVQFLSTCDTSEC